MNTEEKILNILLQMQSDIKDLKDGQNRIEKKIDSVYEMLKIIDLENL